jgi:hypothetical protein
VTQLYYYTWDSLLHSDGGGQFNIKMGLNKFKSQRFLKNVGLTLFELHYDAKNTTQKFPKMCYPANPRGWNYNFRN